jgi:hypothetical protein
MIRTGRGGDFSTPPFLMLTGKTAGFPQQRSASETQILAAPSVEEPAEKYAVRVARGDVGPSRTEAYLIGRLSEAMFSAAAGRADSEATLVS